MTISITALLTAILLTFANAAKLKRNETNLRVTLRSIDDAVISTDLAGLVTNLNLASERLTGWKTSEAIGRPLSEIFNIVNADTLEPVENPTERVLATGATVGLANHTILISKNGTKRQIADSAAPIKMENGKLIGVVIVFRDVDKEYRMQAELMVSKEKYRLIYETSGDAIMTIAPPEWKFTSGNARIIKMFGVADENEFLTLKPWDLSPKFQPDGQRSLTKAQEMIDKAMELGEHSFDWTHIKLHGGEFFTTVLLNKVDLDGKVFIQARVTDITEKVKAERTLRQNEEKYRILFENSNDAMLILKNERFIDCNAATVKMLGYENKEEILNTHPSELSPDTQPDGTSSREKERRITRLVLSKGNHNFEWNHKRKNGEIFPVEVSLTAITFAGETIIHTIWRDITERKTAEKKLKGSEERYKNLINNSIVGVLVAEVESRRVKFANQAACDILGYSLEELLGLNVDDLHPKEHLNEILRNFENHSKGKIEVSPSTPFLRKDGSEAIVDVSGNKTIIDGISCNIGMLVDVTDRKKAEQELIKTQKLRSIGSLAGGIAHDFNNVLLGIFGNLALAKISLESDHPATELISDAEKAMERARRLTNQLLTFSKGGSPVKEEVRLEELIAGITSFNLSGSNVKAVIDCPENIHSLEADKGQIEQVISNLVINADQAMSDGGSIFIDLKNTTIPEENPLRIEPGEYVRIKVRDEGCGIPPEILSHIFDPYFTTKTTGSGIGLATVYSIVYKHDGHIDVDSKLGKGSEFTIHLPAGTAIPKKRDKNDQIAADGSLKGARVLVMDDETYIRELASKILRRLQCQVETAVDGRGTLKTYKENMDGETPFDVVIMDLTIPGGMGGKKTVEKLLELNPKAKVIVCSGYSTDETLANFAEHGFKGKLRKPFTIESLANELKQVL
ncbi:MAG: PAS domain S-box protein [Kiritimatiellaeota bacterium]|nr:PAS domain S-box protein [Kiritimatiellota bacterium]